MKFNFAAGYILKGFCDILCAISLLPLFDSVESTAIRQMIWKGDSTYSNITLPSNLVWQHSVQNKLACSVLCTADTECGAFIFSSTDNKCLASPNLLTSESIGLGTAVVGLTYFFYKPVRCPDDYTYNRKTNLCIKIQMSITKEWSNAKASCEVPPGEGLVTIWNQDQHDFVASEMRRYEDVYFLGAYIDGNDKDTDQVYVSKNGTIMTFFDWDPSYHTDNIRQFKHALMIMEGKTDNVFDDSKHFYICEVVM